MIRCFNELFTLTGAPSFIHSDRGASFLSRELKSYLHDRGVSTSNSTPYHPTGNSQVERYNGIIWKTTQLALRSHNLAGNHWEAVLPEALHAIRSLLCTATNETPHERFFLFKRKSSHGQALPSWLAPSNKVMLRRFNRQSKHEPLVDEVDLVDVNPTYARVRYPNGRESDVSLHDLSPHHNRASIDLQPHTETKASSDVRHVEPCTNLPPGTSEDEQLQTSHETEPIIQLRRSERTHKSPDFYGNPVPH